MSVSDVPADQHGVDDFEPDGSPLNEYLSDIIRLPGYWPADDECTQLKPTGFCEEGHVQFGGKEPCGTRTCPHHWYQWRRRAAAKVVARFAAYRYDQGDEWDAGRRALHVVASPEQEQRWTVSRFWEHRSSSYEAVENVGGRGGAVIPHAFRVSDSGDELFTRWLGGQEAQERGKWRVLREHIDDWEAMQPMVEVAPHFHHLAAVEDLDGEAVAEYEEETGWNVVNVRSLAPFYIDEDEVPRRVRHGGEGVEEIVDRGYEDMAKLVMYLMSHAGIQPETGDLSMRQTVTYWGEVHPASFDPEEALTEEEWETIQKRAAAAVGIEEIEGEEGVAGRECQWEDCEAVVYGLDELLDRLGGPDGPGWLESLPFERACEIWGLKLYLRDRPPPGGAGDDITADDMPPGGFERSAAEAAPDLESRDEYLEWLRQLGRSRIHQNPWTQVESPAQAD